MRPSKSQAKRVGLQTDLRCGLRGGLGQKKIIFDEMVVQWFRAARYCSDLYRVQ